MRNSSALFLFLLLPLAIGGGGDAVFIFGHYLIAGETVDIGERWPELKGVKTIKEAQEQLRVGDPGSNVETACIVLLGDLVQNIARIAHRTVMQCQAAVPILFVAICGT